MRELVCADGVRFISVEPLKQCSGEDNRRSTLATAGAYAFANLPPLRSMNSKRGRSEVRLRGCAASA